jgi:hypothetical protein
LVRGAAPFEELGHARTAAQSNSRSSSSESSSPAIQAAGIRFHTRSIGSQEVRCHLNYGGFRRGDFQVVEKGRTQQSIDENAVMLWIVSEFGDLPIVVVRFEQMCLCASSHLAHVAYGRERHQTEL